MRYTTGKLTQISQDTLCAGELKRRLANEHLFAHVPILATRGKPNGNFNRRKKYITSHFARQLYLMQFQQIYLLEWTIRPANANIDSEPRVCARSTGDRLLLLLSNKRFSLLHQRPITHKQRHPLV